MNFCSICWFGKIIVEYLLKMFKICWKLLEVTRNYWQSSKFVAVVEFVDNFPIKKCKNYLQKVLKAINKKCYKCK